MRTRQRLREILELSLIGILAVTDMKIYNAVIDDIADNIVEVFSTELRKAEIKGRLEGMRDLRNEIKNVLNDHYLLEHSDGE